MDDSVSEFAIKIQNAYKNLTGRNLDDCICPVVVEELWWKTLDTDALERSSVSFFNVDKPETAVSRWARAKTRAAKVGKGLYQDKKARKLALKHWLEAIDPHHRYGQNLQMYYDLWFESESSQPFFYWLDIGDGKEINLEKCPRASLRRQCIKYLGPKGREAYEVIVENGKLVFKQNGMLLETTEGSKWIFVLSTMRNLYVGQKKKGVFQHSSFLSGGATTAAGRLVAHGGALEAIWPHSGHYRPTEENFREFIRFLEENNVDLTNVKVGAFKGVKHKDSGKLSRNSSIVMKFEPLKVMLETFLIFKSFIQDIKKSKPTNSITTTKKSMPASIQPSEPAILFSPRPVTELDAAAIKIQKAYKSYRFRRNLADCAVVVDKLWWKTLDSAALKLSPVSLFNDDKLENAVSRWARARTRAAKV